MDVRAFIEAPIEIKSFQRVLVKTGLFLEMDDALECQVRPRSGLALKKGITVLNTPGTIDADYRGEVGVILMNQSTENVVIQSGDRIAQLVFALVEKISFKNVEEISTTKRGEGGFGSTGIK
jgi:dUTP pyrophosphatase